MIEVYEYGAEVRIKETGETARIKEGHITKDGAFYTLFDEPFKHHFARYPHDELTLLPPLRFHTGSAVIIVASGQTAVVEGFLVPKLDEEVQYHLKGHAGATFLDSELAPAPVLYQLEGTE